MLLFFCLTRPLLVVQPQSFVAFKVFDQLLAEHHAELGREGTRDGHGIFQLANDAGRRQGTGAGRTGGSSAESFRRREQVIAVVVELVKEFALEFQRGGIDVGAQAAREVVGVAKVQDEGQLEQVVVEVAQEVLFQNVEGDVVLDKEHEQLVDKVLEVGGVHRDDGGVFGKVLEDLDQIHGGFGDCRRGC